MKNLRHYFRPRVQGQIPRGIYQELCLLLILMILMLVNRKAGAQELTFDIHSAGRKCGELKLNCSREGTIRTCKLRANVTFRLIRSFDITEEIETVYQGDLMVSCLSKRLVNGALKNLETTRYVDGKYVTASNSGKEEMLYEPVLYSILLMYLKEPVGTKRVFSETYRRFVAIEKNGAGNYLLKLPGDHETEFRYKNGLCVSVHSSFLFLDTRFIRRFPEPGNTGGITNRGQTSKLSLK